MRLRSKDVYKRLNQPESDSDQSDGSTYDDDDNNSRKEYTPADIKYNLVNLKDTDKKLPTRLRPYKGYWYMAFTILMMMGLLIAVLNDVRDTDSYIDKRNKQHRDTIVPDFNKNQTEDKEKDKKDKDGKGDKTDKTDKTDEEGKDKNGDETKPDENNGKGDNTDGKDKKTDPADKGTDKGDKAKNGDENNNNENPDNKEGKNGDKGGESDPAYLF